MTHSVWQATVHPRYSIRSTMRTQPEIKLRLFWARLTSVWPNKIAPFREAPSSYHPRTSSTSTIRVSVIVNVCTRRPWNNQEMCLTFSSARFLFVCVCVSWGCRVVPKVVKSENRPKLGPTVPEFFPGGPNSWNTDLSEGVIYSSPRLRYKVR